MGARFSQVGQKKAAAGKADPSLHAGLPPWASLAPQTPIFRHKLLSSLCRWISSVGIALKGLASIPRPRLRS